MQDLEGLFRSDNLLLCKLQMATQAVAWPGANLGSFGVSFISTQLQRLTQVGH